MAGVCGRSLKTSDGANPRVVADALSVAVQRTAAAQADVKRSKSRPLLPRACKKGRTSQVQLTGKLKVPAGGARVADVVEERQSIRASLPRACKKTSNVQPEFRRHAFQLASGKYETWEEASDYQSAVARHLAESKGCAMAYYDTSFRVVRACALSLNQEIMEALPFWLQHQTFVCRSPPLHIYNFSVTANNTSLVIFYFLNFTPLAPSLSMFTRTVAPFPTLASVVCVTLSFAHA